MNIYGIIYKVVNLINGKVYIGQTVSDFEVRKRRHLLDADKGCEFIFHRAIVKYGKDNFNWSIIDSSYTREELNDKEVYWIDYYNSYSKDENSHGYNMTRGGESLSGNDNPFYGKSHSEESKKKMSNSAKGKTLSEYTKKAIGRTYSNKYKGENNPRYGTKLPEDVKKKISESNKGVKKSESHKDKIRKSKQGSKNPMAKNVIQLSLKGEFVSEYLTIKEASERTGSQSTHIVNCCKGKLKSSNGFIWMYKEDYTENNVIEKVKKYEESLNSKKEIIQLTLDGEFVAEHDSISDGAKSVSGDRSSIAKCCKNPNKSCKGFKWMYKDEYEKYL